jgi:OOP family OmpA-OmpF porin
MSSPLTKANWRSYGGVLVSVIGLAACTGYTAPGGYMPGTEADSKGNAATVNATTSAAKGALHADNTFNGQLGSEYYALSSVSNAKNQYTDADYFARKSLASSKGQTTLPENNNNWGVPGQASTGIRTEMDQQRQRLVAVLDGGARDKYPTLAAQTQTRYDCWVAGSESQESGIRAECHKVFLSNLCDLEVLLHPPGPFLAYFDWNVKAISPEAQQVIKQASEKIPQCGTARTKVIGWADTSGTAPYNMTLSDGRAQNAEQALTGDGIAATRIDITAMGETNLPVPTPEGVREPKNRVVKIFAEVPADVASGRSTPPIR